MAYSKLVQVTLPPGALTALNKLHKVAPTLLAAALRSVPPPKGMVAIGGPMRAPTPGIHGFGYLGDGEAGTGGEAGSTAATPTATASDTSSWLNQLSSFVTTNLPTYLNYQTTQTQLQNQASTATTTAQTQALLAQHGIVAKPATGTIAGMSTTTLLMLAAGLVVLLMVVKKR